MKNTQQHFSPSQRRSNAEERRAQSCYGFSAPSPFSPVAQRVVTYPAGDRQRIINEAETVTSYRDYGTTFSRLNATELRAGNAAAAVVPPVFRFTDNGDNTVRLQVAADAINALSYRMELASAPPWEVATDLMHVNEAVKNMRGYEPVYPKAVDPGTQVRLTVAGAPSDNTFAALIEQHEDVHVQDNYAASREMLEPWDEAITEFRTSNDSVDAASQPEAEAAFYNQVGKTPAQLGTDFFGELRTRGQAFHDTDDGKGPAVADMKYNYTTKHFILTLRHTMGG